MSSGGREGEAGGEELLELWRYDVVGVGVSQTEAEVLVVLEVEEGEMFEVFVGEVDLVCRCAHILDVGLCECCLEEVLGVEEDCPGSLHLDEGPPFWPALDAAAHSVDYVADVGEEELLLLLCDGCGAQIWSKVSCLPSAMLIAICS